MNRTRRLLVAAAVIGIGALAGAIAGEPTHGQLAKADSFLRRYTELLTVLVAEAPLQPVPADLAYSSLEGMLQLLDPHTNFLRPEAFSAMRIQDYKNFLRLHVAADGTLTIHPLCIERVPRRWRPRDPADALQPSALVPETPLVVAPIEPPIVLRPGAPSPNDH